MLAIEYRPLRSLIPYARNSKKHPRSQISKLKASLLEFGWTRPIAIADDVVIFGHGILQAALELAEAGIPIPRNPDVWMGPTEDLSALSKTQRRAYVITDNRLSEDGEWDETMLALEMQELHAEGFDLGLTGFDGAEVAKWAAGDLDKVPEDPFETGELLERMAIAIPEPKHKVEPGQRFILSERHYLLCVGVMQDWGDWTPLLNEGAIFCPYPGPFVPFGKKTEEHQLVMVQPDPYICGHLLDRYEEAFGEGAVRLA